MPVPNTGGMGAYAPAPIATAALREQVTRQVLQPADRCAGAPGLSVSKVCSMRAMRSKGTPYVLGVQRANGRSRKPKSCCRSLQTDLPKSWRRWLSIVSDQLTVEWRQETAVVRGPDVSRVSGRLSDWIADSRIARSVEYGTDRRVSRRTKRDAGQVVTAGGRCYVTAWAPSLLQARTEVYQAVPRFCSRSALSDRISRIERCCAIPDPSSDRAITTALVLPFTDPSCDAALPEVQRCAGCTRRRRTSHRDILWSGRPSDRRSGPTPPGRSEGRPPDKPILVLIGSREQLALVGVCLSNRLPLDGVVLARPLTIVFPAALDSSLLTAGSGTIGVRWSPLPTLQRLLSTPAR